MKVLLAGYNIDAKVIDELCAGSNRRDVTPETLSAAYARISRDPRPIEELRQISRTEVEKARRSNSSIIFKMGHHSVAEHAVFNFDILDVSRLALEEIEKFRLCSYTEKSQRYQKLEGDFIVPEEIRSTKFEKPFLLLIEKQNRFYQELLDGGIEPEDARYATSLSVCGQVGMTINARNLELLFRRFASNSLGEIRALGKKIFELVEKIAPSIILFTEANDFDQKTYPELAADFQGRWERKRRNSRECALVDYSPKADNKLAASLLHTSSGISFTNCLRTVRVMSRKERETAIKTACRHLEFYDAVLREFEHIYLTFDLVMSSGCFAQMKRHRMATITSQRYSPALGFTIPPKAIEAGKKDQFMALINESSELFRQISSENPIAAEYVLTGAHRKRSLMTLNAREMYHLSRLREDIHAQWDIRKLSEKMSKEAKTVMPLTMLLLGGKNHYEDIYKSVYGKSPKILRI